MFRHWAQLGLVVSLLLHSPWCGTEPAPLLLLDCRARAGREARCPTLRELRSSHCRRTVHRVRPLLQRSPACSGPPEACRVGCSVQRCTFFFPPPSAWASARRSACHHPLAHFSAAGSTCGDGRTIKGADAVGARLRQQHSVRGPVVCEEGLAAAAAAAKVAAQRRICQRTHGGRASTSSSLCRGRERRLALRASPLSHGLLARESSCAERGSVRAQGAFRLVRSFRESSWTGVDFPFTVRRC